MDAEAVRPGRPDGPELFRPAFVFPAYLGLAFAFFAPALLPGRQLFGTDYMGSTFFWESFASSELARGVLPAWLPSVYGGVPFFANPMDVYYPVSLVLRFVGVPLHHHLAVLFAVQVFVAGVGTYLLLRELEARGLAAAVAGVAFMLNGALLSMVYGGHDNRAIVASLAPLTFFAIHRAVRTGRPGAFLVLGVVLGAALLPFQIQSSYYLLLAGGLWFGFLLLQRGLHRSPRLFAARVLGGFGALAVAFGLAAVDLLPFAGYVEHSPRGGPLGRGYDYAVSWSMPPEETVGLAVPERSGILDAYVGENPFKLHTEYAGALTLLLCLIGGYVLKDRRGPWFFPALALFGLTLAYGGYTPLYRLYYAVLPGLARFRSPASAFFLVSLALVVFAGLALDRLHRLASTPPEDRDENTAELLSSGGVLAILGAVAAIGWAVATTALGGRSLSGGPTGEHYVAGCWRFAGFATLTAASLWAWTRGHLPGRTVGILLLALTALDLWVVDRQFRVTVPGPDVYLAPDEVAAFLADRAIGWRVHVTDELPQDNYLTHFDLELAAGEHGNQLQIYNEFLGGTDSAYTDKRNLSLPTFLALANVRFLVTTQAPPVPGLREVFRGEHRGTTATVYENPAVLPRAFVAPVSRRMPGPEALFARLSAPGFDPSHEVLLYGDATAPAARPPSTDSSAHGTRSDPLQPGAARITRHTPTEVVVAVEAPVASHLVLTDNWYPDWRATVDGVPAPVLRAYHTFRAVPVEAGRQEVRFTFRPVALRVGFALTLFTWAAVLLAALVTLGRWGTRRRTYPAD